MHLEHTTERAEALRTAQLKAWRASDLVRALVLAIGSAEDAGDAGLAWQLSRLLIRAKRRAEALDAGLDEVAAA
jgi:hypothetical protein